MGILISADEHNAEIIIWLDHHKVPYTISKHSFEVGDYIVGGYEDEEAVYGKIVVEHKTVKDYIASLHTNRMNNQEVDLSYNFRLSVLAITGLLEMEVAEIKQKYADGMTVKSFYFSLTTTAAGLVSSMWKRANEGEEGNIAVLMFDTPQAFVLFLQQLDRWSETEDPRIPKMERLSRFPEYQYQFFLESIPGLGKHRARVINDNFDTPYDLVNASIEELKSLQGIGEVTAKTVYAFFRNKMTREE